MTDAAIARDEADIRPIVAHAASNRLPWIFGGVVALTAVGLFSVLEARRAEISSPAISAPAAPVSGELASPPELAIPPEYAAPAYGYPGMSPYAQQNPSGFVSMRPEQPQQLPPVRVSARRSPTSSPGPATSPLASLPIAQSGQGGDTFGPQVGRSDPGGMTFPGPNTQPQPAPSESEEASQTGDRVRAARFKNPATTVPQGTVMHAVLETALDSTRAGFARAIVSRDVSSFDGSRVLIPKGSKLFGEYQADVSRGQNRALIRWRRLLRPDGTVIEVDSPSADPLGRAGVRGKVNTHFLERFSGAILQSALDLGVQLAARQASRDTYILALPYGTREINPVKTEEIKPTLTVKQGTSVSVFIARDLDFTDVE